MAELDKSTLVGARGWMQWFVGVNERELLSNREAVFNGSSFVNASTGQEWPAGTFECKTVQELEAAVRALPEASERSKAALRVVDSCDIAQLQTELKTEDEAMVQIASNFNCLENPSRGCLPDYGCLVEKYCVDATQGPAASFGVPAASLLRAHYAFYAPGTEPSTWGQSKSQQVELLQHVERFFARCVNGKLTLTGEEEPLPDARIEEVAQQIQVGIHADAEVVFGRSDDHFKVRVLAAPYAKVDQVLSASVNWNSPGTRPAQEQLLSLTRCALRAVYQGAYLAAIQRGRRLLLLTLVGGGVFDNPLDMILEELAAAHARFANHPASKLREVRLCLFPRGIAQATEKKLLDLLAR